MRKRLIPCIFLKEGMIVRSEDYKVHQVIGNPINQVRRYSEWAVDEIIYIDISRSKNYDNRRDDHQIKIPNNKLELLNIISKNIFVPFSFGGGVRSIEEIGKILQLGADKVVLNSVLHYDPYLLLEAVEVFGSQALVACVDYRDDHVFFRYGEIDSKITVMDWCMKLQGNGIGEILLNDISRDGKGCGFDLSTIKRVRASLEIPIVALGGAGDYYDFNECFEEADPSAVAAGNIFHFKEHSYYYAKKSLEDGGIDVRSENGAL
jgi:imidazole glycerol-phosphate synthase subunit HisF